MAATVKLAGIAITKAHGAGQMAGLDYDGEVRFALQSSGIEMGYAYQFKQIHNVDEAIQNGLASLQRELTELLQATDTRRFVP